MSEDEREIDPEKLFFQEHGIPMNMSEADKNLFDKLQETIYAHVTRHGHSYVPEEFEFRASSIAYCPRKILMRKNPDLFLSKQQIQLIPEHIREKDEEKVRFGAHIAGQMIHEIIQEAIEGIVVSMEEEISYKVSNATIKGHYDLLIKDEQDELVVIDIKSTSSRREYLPNPKHLTQLMTYQGMLKGIRGGLLYVNRNNWEMSYVTQEFDKDVFSKIIKKTLDLAFYEKSKKLPDKSTLYLDECGNPYFKCDYYPVCYPDNTQFEVMEEETI